MPAVSLKLNDAPLVTEKQLLATSVEVAGFLNSNNRAKEVRKVREATAKFAACSRRPHAAQGGDMFEERLAAVGEAIDRRLVELLGKHGLDDAGHLGEAMRYAALGGGKRFRPFLVIESARLFGVPQAVALNAAAAVECIHCYSLVHDDLPAMDNDDLRRGRPTVHKAFDEATAILAGDGLLTFAFEILGHPNTHPDPAVRCELVLGLARAAGWQGMAGGQQLDLEAEGVAQDIDGIERIQALKTGALIRFAVEAGAILAQARYEDRQALVSYAEKLGLAFQIADDLLDAQGDAAAMGKATAKDAVAGKATFVSLLGIAAARAKLASLEGEAVAALDPLGACTAMLQEAARFVVRRRS
jgi:farnesyl diphosphate synthase